MGEKYYSPSKSIVEYLQKELRFRESKGENTTEETNAEWQLEKEIKTKSKREKGSRNTIAKAKYDTLDHIFQSFTDIVYFLEFIEDHPKLLGLYEEDLQEFFGIVADPQTSLHHHKNRGGMFNRFIKASLLNNLGYRKEIDFRIILVKMMIQNIIDAMQLRMDTSEEINKMHRDTYNFTFWANLLTKGLRIERKTEPRRLCGFIPYL